MLQVLTHSVRDSSLVSHNPSTQLALALVQCTLKSLRLHKLIMLRPWSASFKTKKTPVMFAPYKSRVVSRSRSLRPLTYLPGTSVGKKITRSRQLVYHFPFSSSLKYTAHTPILNTSLLSVINLLLLSLITAPIYTSLPSSVLSRAILNIIFLPPSSSSWDGGGRVG